MRKTTENITLDGWSQGPRSELRASIIRSRSAIPSTIVQGNLTENDSVFYIIAVINITD
jgi:hypothetical protein